MPSIQPPRSAKVLVVGGGPGGAYAAAVLAREGLDVVLLEMNKFPRYHIGESLLPSVRHHMRFVGAEDKIVNYGFALKPGAAVKLNQYKREGYTDFMALGPENNSWNVVRSEFDQLLLRHAASCGARVFEQTRVTGITFLSKAGHVPTRDAPMVSKEGERSDGLGRPVSATYETVLGGKGDISFDFLIDATGRAGIMSTKYLKNRKFNESLKNVAQWGYWRNTGVYEPGSGRENSPFFEALTDESGWAWFIPLHGGLTSVGIVMDQKELSVRTRAASHSTLEERYRSLLPLAPHIVGLIGDGEFCKVYEGVPGQEGPVVRSASDYSYCADSYAGEGWRIVGDAGAFIDPFFSSGVHLALSGGLAAAASICASLRGDCDEKDAIQWHSSRVAVSYTRFLVVVLGVYKQIRAQDENVLSDVDADNFDKAFTFLRPVIQGGGDMGAHLSDDELQRALDFSVKLFDPTTHEQHQAVSSTLQTLEQEHSDDSSGTPSSPSKLMDVYAPIIDPKQLEQLYLQRQQASNRAQTMSDVAEIKMVLERVNARRVIHSEYGNAVNSIEDEAVNGYAVRLKRGQLGLKTSA